MIPKVIAGGTLQSLAQKGMSESLVLTREEGGIEGKSAQ